MSRYRIVVRGEFGGLLSNAFSELGVKTGGGQTVLTADLANCQELYGILDRLRDFAIEVVSFREVGTTGPDSRMPSEEGGADSSGATPYLGRITRVRPESG